MSDYYKIVKRAFDGSFHSCWDSHVYKVNYKIGEWASPTLENSKLFVFEGYEAAKDFWDSHIIWRSNPNHWALFGCEIDEKIEPGLTILSSLFNDCLKEYWVTNECPFGLEKESPSGTVWANKVKLLKEIEIE